MLPFIFYVLFKWGLIRRLVVLRSKNVRLSEAEVTFTVDIQGSSYKKISYNQKSKKTNLHTYKQRSPPLISTSDLALHPKSLSLLVSITDLVSFITTSALIQSVCLRFTCARVCGDRHSIICPTCSFKSVSVLGLNGKKSPLWTRARERARERKGGEVAGAGRAVYMGGAWQ